MGFEAVPDGFSWSATRNGLFEDCARAYFFHYYLALGKTPQRDERSLEARRLRTLTTVPMWVGSRVHDAIEGLLKAARAGRKVDIDQAVEQMISLMRRDYVESRDDLARERRDFRRYTRFHEHEYDRVPPPEEWKQAASDAERMLRSFAAEPWLERVRELPRGDLLTIEDLDKWSFDGVPVWVKIDLAYRDAEQRVHIVDWKTGKRIREENPLQMTGYAIYAQRKWDASLERLAVREVYLRLEQPEKWCSIDDATIDAARGKIEASIRAMLERLDTPVEDLASEPSFEPNPDQFRCERCNFRSICSEAAISS